MLQCEAESVVNSKYGHYDKGLRSVPVFATSGVFFESANTVAKARAPANLLSFASRE